MTQITDNRRTRAKAATKAKVLEAARTLFAEDGGYEAATMRAIAKQAGMSTGAVFASYDNKAVLYEAIYGHLPITPELGIQLLQHARTLARIPIGPEIAEDVDLILYSNAGQTITVGDVLSAADTVGRIERPA